ncbi:MAG: hypothetical protein ACLPPV_05745 [Candidatus Korobacteraceae bacterium]|jgi:hypothetical protein
MTIRNRFVTSAVVTTVLFSAVGAEAQWVMVARAVSGRIQQMSNKPPNGPGYDVATVVLAANADKVYQTAMKSLQARTDITITGNDAKKREVMFAKGAQVASMQATPLGDKLTQLVIASNLTDAQPSSASLVVQGVLHVCKEMNVACTLEGQ